MNVTYSIPTYKEIIETAFADFNESSVNKIPFSMNRMWINKAQEYICNRLPIPGRRDLRLIEGQTLYQFADTTAYDGVGTISSTGTTVTGVGTSFLNIVIKDSGLVAAGETRKIASVNSNTSITLQEAFSANLAAGTTFKVNGLATELTSEINDIYYIDRIEDGRKREIKVHNIQYLLDLSRKDAIPLYTNLDTPYVAAIERNMIGRKNLTVYPAPDADKTVTLYCVVKVKPRLHVSDTIDTNIVLEEDYECAIRYMFLSHVCRYLKMNREAAEYLNMFERELKTLRESIPCKYIMSVEYQ